MPVAPQPLTRTSRRAARPAFLRGLRLLAGALILSACGGGDGGDGNGNGGNGATTTASVRVTPATGTVDVGATVQLSALVLNGAGVAIPGRTATWTSQTPEIATVSTTGVVTGLTSGTASISASADGRTGTATIAVTPPASARCDVKDSVSVGQTIAGSLAGTDCVLADGTYADKFFLTVAQAGPVRINMAAPTLDAFLILQNATTGAVVAENDDGNGNFSDGARIEMQLQPGRYIVTVNTFETASSGVYVLAVTTGSQACIGTSTFNSPGTVTGTLAATGCVLGDSSYADRYLLNVTTSKTYTVTMRSSAFDAFLFMEDPATGEMMGRNDNSGGGANGKDARFNVLLPVGTYIINANSAGARETGAYTLSVAEDQCQATRTLTVGSTITDTLTVNSCRLADGSYVRRYALTVDAPTSVRLDATSTQFDPYLIVQQAGVTANYAEDDDSGPGTNAQILQVLPTGSYVVSVTTATAGETGIFTLGLTGASDTPVSVSVSPATVSLTPGQVQQLTASVTGNTNTAVLWSSGAPNIAVVTPTGQVRAITAGAATITATSAADASKTATSTITVTDGGSTNLDVPLAYLTQSVQTPDGKVPLVAGRATIVRVFVRGSTSGLAAADVRVRFFDGATLIGTLQGTAPARTALDESCCAADIAVPASFLRDGVTMIADVDPSNTVAESNEGDNAWPLTGASKAIRVVTVPTVRIQLVPIRHRGSGLVGPSSASIADQMPRMFPLGTVSVSVHAEYVTDSPAPSDASSWVTILRQIEALRTLEGSTSYYFGVLNQSAASGVIGIATLGGFGGVGISAPISQAQETFTHEFGHSFGRQHAPTPTSCGAPADVDPNYPRGDGTIGNAGHDIGAGIVLPSTTYEIMGYCDNTWASAYTYTGILAYLRSGAVASGQVVSATPVPTLLISGSLVNGAVTLDPVFTTTSTPTRSRAGRFVAEGLGSDGRVLFTHRFAGQAVPDANVSAESFHELVEYDAATRGAITSIRVRDEGSGAAPAVLLRTGTYAPSGPAGVSLRVDADPQIATRTIGAGRHELTWNVGRYPSVVVRDRRTKTVLALGARGTTSFAARALDDVELLLSDGVSSTTRLLSSGGAP